MAEEPTALGTHQGWDRGEEGGRGHSLCSPSSARRGRSSCRSPRHQAQKASEINSCSGGGAGDPPCPRPPGSRRAADSASYLPSSLICYFSLNTPTPIISVILGNNSPSPNETCIIGRLPS